MNIYTTYFNNISTIFDTTTRGVSAKSPQHAVAKSSQHNVKSSSYDDKTKAGITEIINKYIKKEKSVTNLSITSDDILKLEDELIKRYNRNKSNNFPFPEIKNVLDCISDVLTYFKDNNYETDVKMRWQIDQTINIIKNASQETICADIKYDKCPPEDTISTIKNAKDLKFFKIKNENVIFSHNQKYCQYNVYETPYHGNNYPYAYCIRAMVQSLHMIDLINIDLKHKKDKQIWNKDYVSVYFKERYHYYLDYLLDNAPNIFILPIIQNVGATTLIKNRFSRIQPCQIIFDEAFVDEDLQTPSNFFWHDINHARRIYQTNIWFSKQNKISINNLYLTMRKDVRELIPIKNWLSDEDKKYESLIKILLFEVVHEDALPFINKSIVDDILFESGNCYPYERAYDNDDENSKYNRINLRFYEEGASTLRTIYNKIRHRFFENEYADDKIVNNELRYMKHMIYASYLLLSKIAPNKYNESNKDEILGKLKMLIKDKKFQAHNALRLEGVHSDSDENSRSGKSGKSGKSSSSSIVV
jgi:hypothetical protein